MWHYATQRLLRGVVLTGYALVLALAPLADGMLDMPGWALELHIEAERDGPCIPQHDPAHCVLCRALETGAAPVSAANAGGPRSQLRGLPALPPLPVVRQPAWLHVPARGPPEGRPLFA